MAWEQVRGRRYYYRSKRDGKRVGRVYVGPGLAGELAAEEDRLKRARQEKEKAERICLRAAQSGLAAYDTEMELLLRSSLLAAGYYQHHRYEWRQRSVECNRTASG
jgi:hypothetical protein